MQKISEMKKITKMQRKKGSAGFTLVELLVVVTLIIIVVGVAGDIIVSLVRSYNKTQIQNEIEQNLNFILAKVEKDLRNATDIIVPGNSDTGGPALVLKRRNDAGNSTDTITYEMLKANTFGGSETVWVLARTVDNGTTVTTYPISNYNEPLGITFTDLSTDPFYNVSTAGGPSVIRITLTASHIGGSGVAKQFTSQKTVTSTVVARGTY